MTPQVLSQVRHLYVVFMEVVDESLLSFLCSFLAVLPWAFGYHPDKDASGVITGTMTLQLFFSWLFQKEVDDHKVNFHDALMTAYMETSQGRDVTTVGYPGLTAVEDVGDAGPFVWTCRFEFWKTQCRSFTKAADACWILWHTHTHVCAALIDTIHYPNVNHHN